MAKAYFAAGWFWGVETPNTPLMKRFAQAPRAMRKLAK